MENNNHLEKEESIPVNLLPLSYLYLTEITPSEYADSAKSTFYQSDFYVCARFYKPISKIIV